jgi:hypothetical protein
MGMSKQYAWKTKKKRTFAPTDGGGDDSSGEKNDV